MDCTCKCCVEKYCDCSARCNSSWEEYVNNEEIERDWKKVVKWCRCAFCQEINDAYLNYLGARIRINSKYF